MTTRAINKRLEQLERAARITKRPQTLDDAAYQRGMETLSEALAGILGLPETPSPRAVSTAIREVTA